MLPTQMPFQYDKPLFVKIKFTGRGRDWEVGEEFKWRELNIDLDRIQLLYRQDYLHHNSSEEVKRTIGDGLDKLALPELQALAKEEGSKISNIKDKQIGLIRGNRLNPRNTGK